MFARLSIKLLGLLLILLALLVSPIAAQDEGETTLERVRREGVVRVGFANENPYAYVNEAGELTGEAVEVAREVFSILGIPEMDGVLTEFGSLIPGLQAGRFDVITAGMYITPDRCEQILFADPEYTIGEGLIVEAGNPLNLHSYEDIAANPDVIVGTGAGYLEYDYLLAVGVSEDQIVTFPDDAAGMAGLQSGQIDVWTGTAPTLTQLLEVTGDSGFEMASPFSQPIIDGRTVAGFGAAGFRLEDGDFRDAFNAVLQRLKDDGELVTIIGEFEGFGPETLPGDVTAAELCNPPPIIEAQPGGILERLRNDGVVRVGFANENPYAYVNEAGELTGEAVEVAREVFSILGIPEMDGVLTEFGSLIPGLQAGRFDVITAGMYITPDRCEQILFADPEYTIGEGLIVEAGNPLNLHSYEDIAANPDVIVGTGAGYLEYDYLLAVGVSEDQIVTFPDDAAGMAGLQSGQIDVWTGTAPTLTQLLEVTGDSGFEMASPFSQPIIDGRTVAGFGAAGFRIEDVELRDAFNTVLNYLKDTDQLVGIIGQFEGFGAETLPGDVTAAELCNPE